MPWVNTIATDKRGRALYSDIQVVPRVSDALQQRCGTPLGHEIFQRSAVSILDGSRSDCQWGSEPSAVEPGLFADRSRVAELAAAGTAKMCAAFPDGMAPSSAGPVEVHPACSALAGWDQSYTLDSRGLLLFERFVDHLPPGRWAVPFDPEDPLPTPNTLHRRSCGAAGVRRRSRRAERRRDPGGRAARGASVRRADPGIRQQGFPRRAQRADAELGPRARQHRGRARLQLHPGGPVRPGRLPDVSTLLTYSQSANPSSPHFADQTKLFSGGEWVTGRFCERDIWSASDLRVRYLR